MIQIKQTPLQRILILAKVVVYTTKSPSDYCLAWWSSLYSMEHRENRSKGGDGISTGGWTWPLPSKQFTPTWEQ